MQRYPAPIKYCTIEYQLKIYRGPVAVPSVDVVSPKWLLETNWDSCPAQRQPPKEIPIWLLKIWRPKHQLSAASNSGSIKLDAERVYPDIPNTQLPGHFDRISESLGQFRHEYSALQIRRGFLRQAYGLLVSPPVGHGHIMTPRFLFDCIVESDFCFSRIHARLRLRWRSNIKQPAWVPFLRAIVWATLGVVFDTTRYPLVC